VTKQLDRTLWSNVELFKPSDACPPGPGYCPANCVDRRPADFSRLEAQMAAEAAIADGSFLIAYEWHAYLSPSSTACDGSTPASSPDWHPLPAAQYERYRRYLHGHEGPGGGARGADARARADSSTGSGVEMF
jgi:hypothetical protein